MAPKRDRKKPQKYESVPFRSRKKPPRKTPRLPKGLMDSLVACFKTNGDVSQDLRSDLAAEWFQDINLTKELMQKKISRWVWRQRSNQRYRNLKSKDDDGKKRIRNHKQRRTRKKEPQRDKNEQSEFKTEESDQKEGRKEKNVIKLDDLTHREEMELLMLYKAAKSVTLEMMIEWAYGISKSVHTVLDWIVRYREKDLEEEMEKLRADVPDILDGNPANQESIQEDEDVGQEEADELDVMDASLMNGISVKKDEDVIDDDEEEQEEPEIIVFGDDEDNDEDFLPLKNSDNKQCFMNTIANLLYSCEDVANEIRSFDAYSDHALWAILFPIFTKEVRSTRQWRMTLDKRYHTKEQDVVEVFCLLITNLNKVNKLTSMTFDEKRTSKCNTCLETTEEITTKQLYSQLYIYGKDTFQNAFKKVYGKKLRKCDCGAKKEKEIKITTHGKYHFMVIYHHCVSFESRDASQEFQMFGSTWKIRALAQYIPPKEERSRKERISKRRGEQAEVVGGHYVAWVKNEYEWICVNDKRISQTREYLDFSDILVNIIAFEKVEDEVSSN